MSLDNLTAGHEANHEREVAGGAQNHYTRELDELRQRGRPGVVTPASTASEILHLAI